MQRMQETHANEPKYATNARWAGGRNQCRAGERAEPMPGGGQVEPMPAGGRAGPRADLGAHKKSHFHTLLLGHDPQLMKLLLHIFFIIFNNF